jgi:hypothetical protein
MCPANHRTKFRNKEHFPKALLQFLKDDPQNRDCFEAVWKIAQECGEEERHFNQLQSVYRGLASTWLLATFAAVGYLFNKDNKFFDPYVMGAIVCLAASVGIRLLWTLDLGVYHQLLVAVFREGYKLEEFDWMPGFRTNMANYGRHDLTEPDPIFRRLAIYYLVTTLVPTLGGIVLTVESWILGYHRSSLFLGISLLILLLSVLTSFSSTTRKAEQAWMKEAE